MVVIISPGLEWLVPRLLSVFMVDIAAVGYHLVVLYLHTFSLVPAVYAPSVVGGADGLLLDFRV